MDGVKHTYTLDGTKILRETWGANTLIPLYDNEDSVCGILYNNVPYYFLKNLQGDVIAVTDKNGNGIVGYEYDAWGKCTVTFDISGCDVAAVNPYRYRGYYFDNEIGMYYLQSRYYDAEIGRFVCSDEADFINIVCDQILQHNLYQYCYNNCTILLDENGRSPDQTTMGFGLQFELSGSLFGFFSGCIGLELIWYTSNHVRDARKGFKYPCVYWYYGAGISFSGGNIIDKLINVFKQWLSQVAKKPSKIFSALNVSFGFSACAFLLKGYVSSRNGRYRYNYYRKFTSIWDYTGPASSRSYTAFHVKAYHGYSDTCDTWGLGYDTNRFGTGYSSVRCNCLNAKYIEIPSSITNKIQRQANNAV